jgi:hypothetical protein
MANAKAIDMEKSKIIAVDEYLIVSMRSRARWEEVISGYLERVRSIRR